MYFSFLYFVLILIKYFEGFYSTDIFIDRSCYDLFVHKYNVTCYPKKDISYYKIYCHYVNQYWGASNLVY